MDPLYIKSWERSYAYLPVRVLAMINGHPFESGNKPTKYKLVWAQWYEKKTVGYAGCEWDIYRREIPN